MSTFKVMPDFEVAMAAVDDYARAAFLDDDLQVYFEAAADEAGWSDLDKTEFAVALLGAMAEIRWKKPQ